MEIAKYTIEGDTPLLLQSDTLADPLADETLKLREYSKKKTKTAEDHAAMAKIEWMANIYYSDGAVIMPSQNIHAMIKTAAKLRKKGTTIDRAMIIPAESFPIEYDGSRDLDSMFADPQKRFVDRRTVVVQRARVVRTRPVFHHWKVTFDLMYDASQIDKNELDLIVSDGGKFVGLGTYRPRFGRFSVVD